jgi:membrane-associated protease RseP (regulator of RpoE activity)
MQLEHDRQPATKAERWTYGLTLVLILGLFAVEVLRDFHPLKLSALFIPLFWVPLLALHELGHALIARALGIPLERVVVGFGRPLFRWRAGGLPIEVRAIPLEGFVRFSPAQLHERSGVQRALIYFAGPGAELLVLALLVALVGVDTLLTRSHAVGVIAAQSLSVAILLGTVFNLVPMSAHSDEGEIPNDGMGILLSLFGRRD